MDVYLLFLCVPVDVSVECSHASVLEFKLVYFQVGICPQLAEDAADVASTGSQSAEIYCMEVHKVKQVLYINTVEVNEDRVLRAFRCRTVEQQVLLIVTQCEIVDVEVFVVVGDMAG